MALRAEPISPVTGANTPWHTYEAANAETDGERLASRTHGAIANESVRRACVRLATPGQRLRWTARASANTIVIRHCIPDTVDGGGSTGMVELWIAGKFRQHIQLDSHHAWLYGEGENPQSDNPALGGAHRFFDDARTFVQGPAISVGDTVELRLGSPAKDAPEWLVVDLIDLEDVPPPSKTPPAGHLSAADFGATPDDDTDDTHAIQAGLAAAKEAGKALWLPPGLYLQSASIDVDGAIIRGAGPWHTTLRPISSPVEDRSWRGNAGFRLTGRGSQVHDLSINGTLTGRSGRKQHGFTGNPEAFVIENVWVEHTDTGGWLACEDGIIRRCRFRNTYADGFNINNGSRNIVFEHNHTRNTGDDGLASYSGTDHSGARRGPNRDIVFRNNTAEAPWWAHCLAVYGGENITVEKNLVRGAARAPGIIVSTGHKSWPGRAIRVSGNQIEDSGGTSWSRTWGAMLLAVHRADLSDIMFSGNTVLSPSYSALQIQGGAGLVEATISGNHLEPAPSGRSALHIASSVRGTLQLTDNTPQTSETVRNEAPPDQLKLITRNP